MKPFLQLVPGRDMNRFAEDDGPVPGVGDCWRTSIACILDEDPATVPHFAELPKAEWWQATLDWLAGRNLSLIEYDLTEDDEGRHHWAPPTWCILSGPSPRGDWDHSVVGKGTEDGYVSVVHDPHPSHAGLRPGKWRCAVFVALDPASADLAYDLAEATRRVDVLRPALESADDDFAQAIDVLTRLHGVAQEPCEPECPVCDEIERLDTARMRVKEVLVS